MKPELEKTLAVLKMLCQKLDSDKIPWILTGSTSLILQGVDVPLKDIDILVSSDDCRKISVLLADYIVEAPNDVSETDKYRSNYDKYNIDGIEVDILGNFQYKLPDGSWSKIKDMNDCKTLEYAGIKWRVLPLEEELKEYRAVGRNDKVEAILRKLND